MKLPEYPGADATDLQLLIRELQNKSNGSVVVEVTAPSDKYSGVLYTAVRHTYPHLRSKAAAATDVETGSWPNRLQRSFDAHLYWLVFNVYLQFDSRAEQLELPL